MQLVRNVESTAEPDLLDAVTRIADVDASDGASFLARLKKASCLLLHLSDGTNLAAHEHFEALHLAGGEWAVGRSLAGVALKATDLDVLAARDASITPV
jgi:5-methylthioadenosine/S-adenosylhomocysteine deaminase